MIIRSPKIVLGISYAPTLGFRKPKVGELGKVAPIPLGVWGAEFRVYLEVWGAGFRVYLEVHG